LKQLIGDKNYHQLDPDADFERVSSHTAEGPRIRYVMSQFIAEKEQFGKDRDDLGNMSIDLPEPLNNLTISGVVKDGEITITE
jgi:hypothetical protein